MKTGISLYFGNGVEANEAVIEKARRAGVTHAFTSMHIPEETGVDYRSAARHLLSRCREASIQLMVDVSPVTLEKLGCTRIEELRDFGIAYIRLDFGFTPEQTVALSREFNIVFNASTVSKDDIRSWRAAGADFSRFAACHNFYPKPLSALALDEVRRINERLSVLGFATMAFVPGNAGLRGPIFEGLPTVEAHRNRRDDVALNMLELRAQADTDIVLVGDADVSDDAWTHIAGLSRDALPLHVELRPGYEYLRGQVHHDRPDSSPLVFRSPESRTTLKPTHTIEADAAACARPVGTIAISNARFGRYEGEMEISRIDLAADERMNVAGMVIESERAFLPHLIRGMGVELL